MRALPYVLSHVIDRHISFLLDLKVTLRGGINAGTYKDMGMVNGMPECQKKCCRFSACDLAFLLGGRCYLVGCADEKSCQMNKAKPSAYAPTISYVTRWNTEGVKHRGNKKDNTKHKLSPCMDWCSLKESSPYLSHTRRSSLY